MHVLDDLARKHGTEKSSDGHGYCDLYEKFLGPIREMPIKLLEIGIATGASHRMWAEWMPNARIYGIDTQTAKESGDERITFFCGNQSSATEMGRIMAEVGQVDVIIDDAGHDASDIITCLDIMWPFLRSGGFYVIEDLHVGWDDRNRIKGGNGPLKLGSSTVTTLEHLRSLQNPHPTLGAIEIFDDNIAFLRKPSDR